MPWVHTTKPQHQCAKPHYRLVKQNNLDVGSVWECGKCHKQWRVSQIIDLGLRAGYINWEELAGRYRINGAIPMPGGEPAPAPKQPWYKRRIF